MRITFIALATSFFAGIFAAAMLRLMGLITDFVWARDVAVSPLYIVAACAIGGVLIGLTRIGNARVQTLEDQIAEATDPVRRKRRHIWLIALGASLAVGFGGAVGPEAGLIAVTTELAALVSMVVARTAAEERRIEEASISATLAALYASPPGGAAYVNEPEGSDWTEAKAASLPYLDFLAAIAGVGGFWVAARFLFTDHFHRLELPPHVNPWDGSDMLYALLPGALGALLGAGFLHARHHATHAVEARVTNPVVQSALGGLVFGLLAALLPAVRFSGHHEFEAMVEWGGKVGAPALIGLAMAKMLATTICLATGWRGGAIFPLIFAGGAAGYAAHYLQSGPDLSVALAAGLAGATAAGLGRPIAALLILLFLVGTSTVIAVSVGVGLGMIAARFSPRPSH